MKLRWIFILSVLLSVFMLAQMLLLYFVTNKKGYTMEEPAGQRLQGANKNGNDIKSFIVKEYFRKKNKLKITQDENSQEIKALNGQDKKTASSVVSEGANGKFRTIQSVFANRVKPVCSIPQLDPFDNDALEHIKNLKKLRCPKKYFSRVEKGYLIANVDNVTGAYIEYVKRPEGNDDKVEYSDRVSLIKEDSRSGKQFLRLRHNLTEDFVKLTIVRNGITHIEHHACVVPKPNVIERAKAAKEGGLQYNVAFLMIDSQSASNVKRKLKKVYNYLLNDKTTFIFEGHSIVGDGTTAQLSAILTGAFEWDFPESRRGFAGGKTIDDWPFVFQNFTKRGYVTMFNEDEPTYAAFNYRLHGFQKQPTDHYARPFWLDSKSDYYGEGICHGDYPIHMRTFDYLMEFHESYIRTPKFSLSIISAMIHDNLSKLSSMDEELLNFIESMKAKGYFEDTIFILFGDHGARFAGFRETMTGKLEERLPFLSITLPKELLEKHPEIKKAMNHNTKVLTSFFDIHATLHHLLLYPALPEVNIGHSLFNRIDPETRTCEAAGIKEHWCPCLQFAPKNTTDKVILSVANAVVDYINVNITGRIPQAKSMCSVLKLSHITRAGQRIPNERVRKFKQTAQNSKCIECDIILDKNDKSLDSVTSYEIVLSTTPGNGVFEASVTVNNNRVIVNPEISRLNRYGTQPKCIQKQYPLLRKYCYCVR